MAANRSKPTTPPQKSVASSLVPPIANELLYMHSGFARRAARLVPLCGAARYDKTHEMSWLDSGEERRAARSGNTRGPCIGQQLAIQNPVCSFQNLYITLRIILSYGTARERHFTRTNFIIRPATFQSCTYRLPSLSQLDPCAALKMPSTHWSCGTLKFIRFFGSEL